MGRALAGDFFRLRHLIRSVARILGKQRRVCRVIGAARMRVTDFTFPPPRPPFAGGRRIPPSAVADHRVRHVWRLERGDLLGDQRAATSAAIASSRCSELRRADDRRRDPGLLRAPRRARPARAARRVAAATAATARSPCDPPRRRRRASCRPRRSRSRAVRRAQSRVRRPRASGLHGMTPMPSVAAQRQHLALLLAVEQVEWFCIVDEARPAVPLGHVQRLRELPGVHRRRADVARLAGLAPRRAAPRASPRSACA